jgi:hypothetical protein
MMEDWISRAQFGIDVENFLKSPIGVYILNRSEAEIAEAVETLKKVEPSDSDAIRKLQSVIARNESLGYWLADAIQAGLEVERQLAENDM